MFSLVFLLVGMCACSTLTRQLVTHHPQARCIDGSWPGYYSRLAATGDNWLLVLLGGGWCHTPQECYERSQTLYGSSTFWPASLDHGLGLTSANASINPTFHDWNVVVYIYCDGSSYSGGLDAPYVVNGTQLFSRGQAIFDAVLDDIEHRWGVPATARTAVLYGESAGGIGCLSHVDQLAARWPTVDVRGLCDSSFFIPVAAFSPPNTTVVIPTMSNVFKYFNVTAGLDQSCVAGETAEPFRCLVAETIVPYISAPLFMLQSQVDCDQFENVGLDCLPAPNPTSTPNCNSTQLAYIKWFQNQMRRRAVHAGLLSGNRGLYFDSCVHHSIALFGGYWNDPAYTIGGVTAAGAVALWLAGQPAVFADSLLYPHANPRCVAAFQSCLGDVQLPPWQCGPAKWQAHDC